MPIVAFSFVIGGVISLFTAMPASELGTAMPKAGRSLEVPITMKSTMSSALASSRTDIFVYDDRIVVEGPAVPDGEMGFDQPASASP